MATTRKKTPAKARVKKSPARRTGSHTISAKSIKEKGQHLLADTKDAMSRALSKLEHAVEVKKSRSLTVRLQKLEKAAPKLEAAARKALETGLNKARAELAAATRKVKEAEKALKDFNVSEQKVARAFNARHRK